MHALAVAEISAEAIRHNIETIRRRLAPGVQICAMVKADAYGHGVGLVLPALTEAGVERLAVAQLPEAIALRQSGWTAPILCLGSPLAQSHWHSPADWANEAIQHRIHCTLCSMNEAHVIAEAARRASRPAVVEIKVDTGMGRMGFPLGDAVDHVTAIAAHSNAEIDSVFTHLATADDPDPAFTEQQLSRFTEVVQAIKSANLPVKHFHAANSGGIFRHHGSHFDIVRPGLSVYGYWDGPRDERPPLVPAMRLVAELVAVREVPKGHAVGYGCTFRTERDSLIGVVPIGYGDGYRRSLGNDAVMTINTRREHPPQQAPVIGRVSMDLVTIDVTDVPDVRTGDTVVVIDNDPTADNSVESFARKLDTIPYEITTAIGNRVARVPC